MGESVRQTMNVDVQSVEESARQEVPSPVKKISHAPAVKKAVGLPRAPALPVSKGCFSALLANDSDSDDETESTASPPSAGGVVDFIPDLDVGHRSSDPATWYLLQKARSL